MNVWAWRWTRASFKPHEEGTEMTNDKNKNTRNIGYIGLGTMGAPMAANLVTAGYHVTVWNRTQEKTRPLLDLGAALATTPADLAPQCDVIFINVSRTADVKEVLFGENGLAQELMKGQTVIDNSTISPTATERIAARLSQRGTHFLDAPVSGGSSGAQTGTLSIMVGGDKDAYEKCLPLLEVLGKSVTYLGPAGKGQTCKACNQIAVACNLLGVCEAMAFARKLGLDLGKMLDVVTAGAGTSAQMEKAGPRIASGNMAPGFKVELMLKDLNIVSETVRQLNLPLHATSVVTDCFRSLTANGFGHEGTQALSRILEKLAGFEFRN